MRDALLVLLGAVVGAVGSVAGSIFVNRAELARRARIRMYKELVGPILEHATGPYRMMSMADEDLHSLYREAVLARRSDRQRVGHVLTCWHEQADLLRVINPRVINPGPPDPEGQATPAGAEWNAANERYVQALRELEDFLERKLR